MYKRLMLLWLLCYAQVRTNAKSNFEVVYKNISCSRHDPKGYLVQLDCYMSKNAKLSSFSIDWQFSRNIAAFMVDVLILLPRQRSSDDFVMLNLTALNGCQLLANKRQVTFMQLGRDLLERFGNLPQQCPFRRNVLYYVRGFRLNLNLIPALAFETDMNFAFALWHDGERLIRGHIASRIQLRKRNQRGVGGGSVVAV